MNKESNTMRDSFLPFSKPSIDEDDIAAVAAVLRSAWITTGPQAAQFEEDFKRYTGCSEAVAMTSETAVMQTLIHAIGLKPGDEVITPSMTWVSLPNLVTAAGATPVFADVDKDTLMVSGEEIESKITPRTKLIVPVHFAGAALDLDKIRAVAKKHNIMLIEDAAHALGTEFKGEKIGAKGHAMFSFHPIKNITTAEGGMFVTDDPVFAGRIRSLKFHGLGVDAYDRQTHQRAPQAEVMEPGFKYNLPDVQAVLGVRQLAKLDQFNANRTFFAMRYREKLANIPELVPLADPPYPFKHSHHLFIVRLDIDKTGISRDDFMLRLKEQNIGTGLHFRCTHKQKFYRETMPQWLGKLPNTEYNSDRIFSLPLFPDMTEKDQDDVLNAIKKILNQ